ncbi:MAG: MarR family transcriptional regulator [Bacillota bacterium]|nr:MarR family transcriptional regulator [Bacillota bacterium]
MEAQIRRQKLLKLLCATVGEMLLQPTLEEIERSNLTDVQLAALRYLLCHTNPTAGEMAEGLHISRAAVSKLLDRLAHKKMLRRLDDYRDRRRTRVELTAEGKRLVEEVLEREKSRFAEVFARLSEEELAHLEQGIEAFLRATLTRVEDVELVCLRCGTAHLPTCPGNVIYKTLTGQDKDTV